MKNQPIHKLSPLTLRGTKSLKNRIIVPPMASETADEEGFATEKTLQHYKRLSESGAGLIIVEYTYVHESGRSEANQLSIHRDDKIKGLTDIARVIHESGAMAGIQLTHAGGKTETQFSSDMQSPSGIVVPVKDKELEKSSEMNLLQIKEWKISFREAAIRAVKAGFDLIEIHAAHGYGLNQWLSPLTNKRNDYYGGSLENNFRLLKEIIQEIQQDCPDLLISVRMPGQDFIQGGLDFNACLNIAQDLNAINVDFIHISSGIGGCRRPGERHGEGYLVEEASLIAHQISTPVIGVGGIESAAYINHILNEKKIALAAVGRAILKAPKTWGDHQLRSFCHD